MPTPEFRTLPKITDVLSIVREGAALADSLFIESQILREKDAHGDLLTHADLAVQDHIVARLQETFPHISIVAEEDFSTPAVDLCWVVDPLDGSNNFAIGIPSYAVSIALVEQDRPLLAAVAQGQTGSYFTAAIHTGIQLNGHKWTRPLRETRTKRSALWLGYGAASLLASPNHFRTLLNAHTSRVLETWSPLTDLFAVLNGSLDLIVAVDCKGMELPAALTTLSESGFLIVNLDPSRTPLIGAGDGSFVAGWPDQVAWFLKLLDDEGLSLEVQAPVDAPAGDRDPT